MSSSEPDLALPILGWGIAGGLLGSLSCCCWFGPAAAGWMAGRQAGSDGGARLGLGVGLVSALMVSTLGTALFLVTSDPDLLGEVGADDVPLAGLAAAYALLGFGVSFAGAALGALLGAGGVGDGGASADAGGSALRFLDDAPRQAAPSPAASSPAASSPAAASPAPAPAVVDPPPAGPPPPQNDETPAAAGAVEVDSADLASSDDEQDAWD